MSNQFISFDVTKENAAQPVVTGRQGDSQLKNLTISFWDGERNTPYDLTGKTLAFEALKPDDTHIVDTKNFVILNQQGGIARYTFTSDTFAADGTMKQAFFKISRKDSQGNVTNDSTIDVNMTVLKNDVEKNIKSGDYFSEYDRLVAEIEKKFADFSATVNDSIEKAQQTHDEVLNLLYQIESLKMLTIMDTNIVVDDMAIIEINGLTSDKRITLTRSGSSPVVPPDINTSGYINTDVVNITTYNMGVA